MRVSSRGDAEARYQSILVGALARATELARERSAPAPVELKPVTSAALRVYEDTWLGHPARRVQWNWAAEMDWRHRAQPKRFECAIWSGDVLCGLAVGNTRNSYCAIDLLEGNPNPEHPLRGSVVILASGAAFAYALALPRPQLRLVDPVEAMIPRYLDLGFQLDIMRDGSPYCWVSVP